MSNSFEGIGPLRLGWFIPLTCAIVLGAACSDSSKDGGVSDDGSADSVMDGQSSDGDIPTNPLDGEISATDAPEDGSPVGEDKGGPAPEPGEFGAPCTSNTDCHSGFCVWSDEGYVCTQECVEECPDGFSCKGSPSAVDPIFICIPNVVELCQPCKNDYQCNGGVCVEMGNGDHHCTVSCELDPCAKGYECDESTKLCMPETGTCGCTVSNTGKVRSCSQSDGTHVCEGYQECLGAAGWGECSAMLPSQDICDGIDNNCNGQIDEESGDGDACSNANEFGTCVGTILCNGSQGDACTAQMPEAELCDYKDNDCDDAIDEDFKGPNGTYDTVHHCGGCNEDCEGAIPNATTLCDSSVGDIPVCVIDQCDEGYYPINEVQCASATGSLCTACSSDSACPVPGSKCSALDDGTYCTVPCGANNTCPPGYFCETQGQTAGQCVPNTGACSCDGTNLSLQKSCEKTWQDPDNADGPVVTCTGVQHCTAGGWSPCKLDADVCDGVDNDCDGMIDGPWLNDSGQYDKVTHCGMCGNNCLAQMFKNATGYCDLSGNAPACAMTCNDGYHDLDGNPTNGCECAWDLDEDHPDGIDQNCDGIDGEIDNATFVSKTGNDANDGSITSPLLTIQAGINRAETVNKRDVYVATGVYSANITLKAGVSVYGGYSGDFKKRDTTLYETAILATKTFDNAPGAVNGMNLSGSVNKMTILDGFTIFGVTNKQVSGNSYGLWLVNCGNQVSIRNNLILAGSGGNGQQGSMGVGGKDGSTGINGSDAYDIGVNNCKSSHGQAGGTGGQNSCNGQSTQGGQGGSSVCPKFDEDNPYPQCPKSNFQNEYKQTQKNKEHGANGNGAAPGTGGKAGWDSHIRDKFGPYNNYNCITSVTANCGSCLNPSSGSKHGFPGTNGAAGNMGAAGAGCTNDDGTVVTHQWTSEQGGGGGGGTDGSGGGGGGASGGVETWGCSSYAGHHDMGASGGGGGSGGCGGTQGTGGTGGGGSFALFVSWTNTPATYPQVTGNTLVTGNGGDGGNGGPGGTGGAPGAGGSGGGSGPDIDELYCTSTAAEGGNGGQGGHGGGGGGGCGGVSYGIYAHGGKAPPEWKTMNSFDLVGSSGASGQPGPSLGNAGTPGVAGGEGDTNF